MNKILRFSMMAVLALVANIGFAQTTILWQEDFSSYKDKEVPKGGTYNYACEVEGTKVYKENRAGGESPELLIAKKDTKKIHRVLFLLRYPLMAFRVI